MVTRFLLLFILGLFSFSVFADTDPEIVKIGKKGIEASARGDLMTAMNLLEQAGKAGYTPAQVELAYLLNKADYNKQAFEWYLKAAESGDASGQYGVAGMYAAGDGVEKNVALARQWFERAADQKHLMSYHVLAVAYEKGDLGLEKNPARALEFYRRCHEGAVAKCTVRLAKAYGRAELGLTKDVAKAKELYSLAKEQNR